MLSHPRWPGSVLQVKLFVELFSSKYQSLFFKLLRAGSDDEVTELAKQMEHNLEVRPIAHPSNSSAARISRVI
jgi:hypothetical protein